MFSSGYVLCVCVWQDDFRFLYEALLTQVSFVPSDTNGSVTAWRPTDSLESLV